MSFEGPERERDYRATAGKMGGEGWNQIGIITWGGKMGMGGMRLSLSFARAGKKDKLAKFPSTGRFQGGLK